MTGAANTPEIPWEVLAALARLSPKHFGLSCEAFATLLRTTPKALRAAVTHTKESFKDELPYAVRLPLDQPVDLPKLLSELAEFLRRYLIVTPEQADAMTLWVANTYVFDLAEHSPLLIVNAPAKSCGKTLAQKILATFASRSMSTANATPAALFRIVELHRPTLFMDEADTFIGRNPDLHGLINSGHQSGVPIWRTETVGDSHEVKLFDVFCPKSIAGIALERHLPDATMSRGIIVNMRRKVEDERVEDWRDADRRVVERLGRGLARAAEDYREAIETARPARPPELADRDQDNWLPLLAVASAAGAEWLARANAAAIALSGKALQPESVSHELLNDIRDILDAYERELDSRPDPNKSKKYITTSDLLTALLTAEDSGWNEYYRGEPLSAKQLAKQLAPYGLRPKIVRIREGLTPKGYEIRIFREAFPRYLKDREIVDLEADADPRCADAPADPPQLPPEPPQADAAY